MDSVYALPLIAGGIMAFFCHRAYTLSSQGVSDFKEAGDSASTAPTLSQFEEVSNDFYNPLNTTSNMSYMKVVHEEPGPFGVPRVIYQGPGGSWIPTFGYNYDKF